MATKSELRERITRKRLRQKLLGFEAVLARLRRVLQDGLQKNYAPKELQKLIEKVFREFLKARILEQELVEDADAHALFSQLDFPLREDVSKFVLLHHETWKHDMETYTGVRNLRTTNLTKVTNGLRQELHYIESLERRLKLLLAKEF